MSDRIKAIIGEDLYTQVKELMGDKSFDLLDGFVPRTRLNEVSEKFKVSEGKVADYEKQLKDTKALISESEEYKGKYTELETKFNNTLAQKDIDMANVSKRFLVKESLVKNGAKHVELLIKEINMDDIKLDNDKIIGITDIVSDLKTTYGDLFTETTNASNNDSTKDKKKKKDNDDEPDWEAIANKYV